MSNRLPMLLRNKLTLLVLVLLVLAASHAFSSHQLVRRTSTALPRRGHSKQKGLLLWKGFPGSASTTKEQQDDEELSLLSWRPRSYDDPTKSSSFPPVPYNRNSLDESSDLDDLKSFGLVAYQRLQVWTEPVQDFMDTYTDGWVLSYADLAPDNPGTAAGQTFLATNIAYAAAGLFLSWQGDFAFGFLTEITALASFNYHYWQLQQTSGGSFSQQELQTAPTVRLALLVDYVCAFLSIATAGAYLLTATGGTGHGLEDLLVFSPEALTAEASVVAGLLFLGLSWVYESGKQYMIFHSLWHLFSAYAGYLIGTLHLATTTVQ